MKKEVRQKIFEISGSAALCAFAALSVCFFMPLDIYMNNAADMPYPIKSLVKYLAAVSAAVFAALFLCCLLIKGKANGIFRSAVFGLALALYVQGNMLAMNMGELDGTEFKITALKAALNILIWLVILAVPFFLYFRYGESFNGTLLFVSAALIILQAVSMNITYKKTRPTWGALNIENILYGDVRPICTTDNLNLYSNNRNIIVILTDAYDSFYFDEAAKAEPDALSEFDGFTYYTNTVGVLDSTYGGVANILTGTKNDSLTEAYENETLFRLLNESFITDIYGDCTVPPVNILENYTDNFLYKKITFADTAEYSSTLFRLTFFRCMPEAAKPAFWVGNDEIGNYNPDIMDGHTKYSLDNLDLLASTEVEYTLTDEKVFKFIHINGLHYPKNTTKDLERDPSNEVPEDEIAIAVNKILNRYLAALKENGVYDNSDIFVLADHGLYLHYDKKYPLLMCKPADQTGTGITVSNAPISMNDVYPTLIRLAGGETDGRTIFDIGEDEERVRHFVSTDEDIIGNIKENPQ